MTTGGALALLAMLVPGPTIVAQPVPLRPPLPVPGAATPAPYTLEVGSRDRWIHGRQLDAVVPFHERQSWVRIDSLLPAAGGGRTLVVRSDGSARATVRLSATADGRVRVVDVSFDPDRASGVMRRTGDDSLWLAQRRYFDGERLALPAERAWDVVPAMPPVGARRGTRWRDSVAVAAEGDGMRQEWRGSRVSVVVGDTVVDGRRLWIVRDSVRLRYEERALERERTLGGFSAVERVGQGLLTGRHLLDPELALFRARHDTLVLAGEAVLRQPDGRTFRTPARYERSRRYALYEPAALEARRQALRVAADRAHTGMLVLPRTTLDQRLAAGDSTVLDSLADVVRRAPSPAAYDSAVRSLTMWGLRSAEQHDRLVDLQLAAGDTARAVSMMVMGGFARRGLSMKRLALLLPLMRDPAAAFALGVRLDEVFGGVTSSLVGAPPAIQPDSTRWPCTPEACRLLAAQGTAAEPRLRDVALVARATMEPARWRDTVLAHAGESPLVAGLLPLVHGIGATWPAASKAPMPPPSADWRSWSEWMNGVDPAYREQMTRFGAGRPRELTRFEQSHEHAIRYHAVLTGRDVIAELRRAMAAATSDSSRLVYGAMLLGLGELVPDADSVARRLRGSDVERQLASLELNSLFGGGVALGRARPPLAPRADEATAAALLDTLLAIVITGAPAWPPLDSGAVGRRQAERVAEAGTTVFVLGDDLPAVVRERWSSRARIVTSEEWRQRRLESGGVLVTPFAVRLAGPLALVQYDRYSVQLRGDGRAPYGYASGRTFYLLRTDEGWRVVGGGMWIT